MNADGERTVPWKPYLMKSPVLPLKYDGLSRVKLVPEPETEPSWKIRAVRGRSVSREMVKADRSKVRGILSLPCQFPGQLFLSTIRASHVPGGERMTPNF